MKQNRNRAYRRHQRTRAIARKVKIFTEFWGNELVFYRNGEVSAFPVGKYAKGKVHCSCKLCKFEEYYKIPKEKDRAKQQAMQQAIDEVLADGD